MSPTDQDCPTTTRGIIAQLRKYAGLLRDLKDKVKREQVSEVFEDITAILETYTKRIEQQ